MMKYTPLQTVNKCHRELWWTIRLMGSVEVQLDENSDARIDLIEVEKVLRHACLELGRIIRAMEQKESNLLDRRQGRDLALKAQAMKNDRLALKADEIREKSTSSK